MERVEIFKVGTNCDGKVIPLTKSFSDFLSSASRKLGISAQRIFTVTGCEIDDVDLIRDNDRLYVSAGGPFIEPPSTSKNISVSVQAAPDSASIFSEVLESDLRYLRRNWYILWGNNENLSSVFTEAVERLRNFFSDNFLKLEEAENEDILYPFITHVNDNKIEEDFSSQKVDCKLTVFDTCLQKPINISKRILNNHKRGYASCNMKGIGFQHVFRHNMIDSSASEGNSSCDDQPPRKVLKTCQRALFVDCQNLLPPHLENSTRLIRPETKVEILILCNNFEMCKKLSKHLGLIFLDDLLYSSEVKDYESEMINSDFKFIKVKYEIDNRLADPNAKLYDLLQSLVNKSLITGYNNIALTCNYSIFDIFGAYIKCLVSTNVDSIFYKNIKSSLNMNVKLENDDFLDYISALGKILDESSSCKVCIDAVYSRTLDEKKNYFTVKLPIIAIIPMYIVNYFAAKKMAQEMNAKSLV